MNIYIQIHLKMIYIYIYAFHYLLNAQCPTIIRKREGEGVRCVLCAEGGTNEGQLPPSIHPSDRSRYRR